MIAPAQQPMACRSILWIAGASAFITLAAVIWFAASFFDSLAIGVVVVATLLLPLANQFAQPRSAPRRSPHR